MAVHGVEEHLLHAVGQQADEIARHAVAGGGGFHGPLVAAKGVVIEAGVGQRREEERRSFSHPERPGDSTVFLHQRTGDHVEPQVYVVAGKAEGSGRLVVVEADAVAPVHAVGRRHAGNPLPARKRCPLAIRGDVGTEAQESH